MSPRVRPFLMFQDGRAGAAARAYAAAFDAPEPVADAAGVWTVDLNGLELRLFDSPVTHDFGFTPASSLFVTCDTAEEVDRLAAALGKDGEFLMPLDSYDFSPRYCWFNDQFGVSWQLGVG